MYSNLHKKLESKKLFLKGFGATEGLRSYRTNEAKHKKKELFLRTHVNMKDIV